MPHRYSPGPVLENRLDNDFRYHPPTEDQVARYGELRAKARELAQLVAELTPPCREQSLAFTKIEEAAMFANAAIARNE